MKINVIFNLISELLQISVRQDGVEFPNGNLIFRGQSNISWGLLPKLFRDGYGNNSEDDLIEKYKQRYLVTSGNYIDHVSDMQHYGMPTKLLDWTTNLLIALFFAIESNDDKDGILYILDADRINCSYKYFDTCQALLRDISINPFISDADYVSNIKNLIEQSIISSNGAYSFEDPYPENDEINVVFSRIIRKTSVLADNNPLLSLPIEYKKELFRIFTKPILIQPPSLNPRVIAQSSIFTYHFGETGTILFDVGCFDFKSALSLSEHNPNSSNLYGINIAAIKIPAHLKYSIRYELKTFFNISVATVYPDDKEKVLSQYVNYQKSEDKKSEDSDNLELQKPKLFVSKAN